ncbi:MAG: type II toxin-antitoxin system prevent-host-death family antitoxin [Anaerolineales bacterium]|jgi:antitoxin YefM|nr:type II toxin-antitoxin system prevent-host-death family antitoxin [Anaerolineales bacterium]
MTEVSYSRARQQLASLMDEVTRDRNVVIIHRRNGSSAALIAADELEGLLETAHLLRSPANAQRLLTALGRALADEGEALSLDRLKTEVDLDKPPK